MALSDFSKYMSEVLASTILKKQGRRFLISECCESIMETDAWQEQKYYPQEHIIAAEHGKPSPWIGDLKERVKRGIVKQQLDLFKVKNHLDTLPVKLPKIRLYPCYNWFGDYYYQHFNFIPPEMNESALTILTNNRRNAQNKETVMEFIVQQTSHYGCSLSEARHLNPYFEEQLKNLLDDLGMIDSGINLDSLVLNI